MSDIKEFQDVSNIVINSFSAFQNISKEDAEKWDKYVAEHDREIIIRERARAYAKCGIGEEYINASMQNVTDSKLLEVARQFYSNVIHGNRANLICLGDVGSGKTYLMDALLRQFAATVKQKLFEVDCYFSVRYVTSKNICDRLHQTEGFNPSESRNAILKDMLEADVLVIDEVGRYQNSSEAEYLFAILDTRYQKKKSTMLATNMNNDEIMNYLGVSTLSRLKANNGLFIADFTGKPDLRNIA